MFGADDLLRGTVILMPALNPPAVEARTRVSPIDEKNLNRVFPGDADGTITERIAHLVTSRVLPLADVVLDLHADGQATDIMPSMMIHELRSTDRMARTVAVMKAFRAPVGILIKEFESEGMLDTTVECMGKIFGCCELGRLGRVTPETVEKGQPLNPDALEDAPVICVSPAQGVLYQRRDFCLVEAGAKLALVAEESTRWDNIDVPA